MGQVTELLRSYESGDPDLTRRLFSIVYDELRAIARRKLRLESSGHLLQPTALVNEAFLRLVNTNEISWNNRVHFFRASARAMSRILIDEARKRAAAKRGGPNSKEVPLDEAEPVAQAIDERLIDLDEALKKLELVAPKRADLVRLHFFAGLTLRQCAELLGVSLSTVERNWRFSRAWLAKCMESED